MFTRLSEGCAKASETENEAEVGGAPTLILVVAALRAALEGATVRTHCPAVRSAIQASAVDRRGSATIPVPVEAGLALEVALSLIAGQDSMGGCGARARAAARQRTTIGRPWVRASAVAQFFSSRAATHAHGATGRSPACTSSASVSQDSASTRGRAAHVLRTSSRLATGSCRPTGGREPSARWRASPGGAESTRGVRWRRIDRAAVTESHHRWPGKQIIWVYGLARRAAGDGQGCERDVQATHASGSSSARQLRSTRRRATRHRPS